MPLTLEQFQQQVSESGLIPAEEFAALVDALPPERKADAEQLARELVRQKKLTAFQAQQIYQGKGKHLVLGNYVALDKLGQGGMGMVLKAEHRRMKRLVALKVLSPNVTMTPEALRRFQREVEAAAKLEHPNIVTAFDADEAAGTHFLVMQYVEGTDLANLVKKNGPLTIDKALTCVIQAARGLDYAHSRGVVHRDIKPANLLLDREGTIKILDMGLARLENAGGQQDQLTGTGQIMGTVDYMAPEQAMDTKNADARADIYSLGVTLWHLLTARVLYEGDTTVMKLMAHQNKPVPSLRMACPSASPALEAVFTRMVAKTPESRYQTMKDVIADLERCQSGQAMAPSVSTGPGEDSRLNEFLRGMGPAGGVSRQATAVAAPATTALEQTVNLSDAMSGTDPQAQQSLPRSVAAALTGRRTSRNSLLDSLPIPPKYRLPALIGGGLAAAAVLLAGILLFWQTDQGTVRIEINDPKITVQVDGQGPKITQLDKDPIELTSGQHGLRIKVGDLDFETDTFVLADGDDVRLKVELLNGEIQVVNGDEPIGVRALSDGGRASTAVRIPISPPAAADQQRGVASTGPALWNQADAERLQSGEYAWSAPESLGDRINTAAQDMLCGISSDELTVYISRDDKLYAHRREAIGQPFSEGRFLGLNAKTTGGVSVSANGLIAVGYKDGQGGLRDIWISTRGSTDEPFPPPVDLPAPANDPGDDTHPALSADGRTLLISSSRSYSRSADVWMLTRDDVTQPFGAPVLMLDPVNTGDWDMPYWISDARTELIASTQAYVKELDRNVREFRFFTREKPSDVFRPGTTINSSRDPAIDTTEGVLLSADRRSLYFSANAANLPGYRGNHDVWVCRLKSKTAQLAVPWQSLFNGHSFDGWQNAAGGPVPANWKIEDNAIAATGRGTNIATTAGYSDFDLEFDWRVSAGANGGVYYGWDGTSSLVETALEYQVVDNRGHDNGRKPETSAGSAYGLYGPTMDATKSVGQWNRARIVVRGDQIEHWLNDQRIVSLTIGDADWQQRTKGRSHLARALGTRGGGRGRFVLQSNGGTVGYRNLRVRAAGPSS